MTGEGLLVVIAGAALPLAGLLLGANIGALLYLLSRGHRPPTDAAVWLSVTSNTWHTLAVAGFVAATCGLVANILMLQAAGLVVSGMALSVDTATTIQDIIQTEVTA